MDLESEARRGKESVEKELREVQVRLAGLEGVDVKMLKDTVRTLQRQVIISILFIKICTSELVED